MRSRATWWAGALLTGACCAAACQGSSVVNDVGDVDSPHAGEAGAGGATSGTGGGAGGPPAGRGGAAGAAPTVGGGSGRGAGLGAEGGSAPIGGTGAYGGSGVEEGGSAGSGVDEQEGDCVRGPGCLFAAAPTITALATDSKRVYWAEYGAKDELGNYSHAGRVLARDFDGKNQRTLVDGLDGPMGLAVTKHYVYVYLDGGKKNDKAASLVRAPIEGGDAALVLDGATPRRRGGGWCEADCVSSNGEVDFFSDQGIVYSMGNEAGAAPEPIHDGPIDFLDVDDTYLYFSQQYGEGSEERWSLERVPLTGGTPTELGDWPLYSQTRFPIVGEEIYIVEIAENFTGSEYQYDGYLARAPKDGSSPFVRVANLGTAVGFLTIFGERFFAEAWIPAVAPESGMRIVTGLLSDPTHFDVQPGFRVDDAALWKASPVGVFWAVLNRGELRFSALP